MITTGTSGCITAQETDRPAYWTDRQPGEQVISWVLRMQALYRIFRLLPQLEAENSQEGG